MTNEELSQLVAGNARAIQALGNEIAEFKRVVTVDHEQSQSERQALSRDVAQLVATQEQNSRELSQAMIRLADTQEGIARLFQLGRRPPDDPAKTQHH